MRCLCSYTEMFRLRTLLARLDYILGHKSQHMLSEWLLWGICPYCSVTLKLLSSILTRRLDYIQYNLSLFSSASVCRSRNDSASFMRPYWISHRLQKIKLVSEGARDISASLVSSLLTNTNLTWYHTCPGISKQHSARQTFSHWNNLKWLISHRILVDKNYIMD